MARAGVTIRRTRRLPRALGHRGRQKYNCVVQKVTNVHQTKGMNMMKVNETLDHVVYEKIRQYTISGLLQNGKCFSYLVQFHIYQASYVASWQ